LQRRAFVVWASENEMSRLVQLGCGRWRKSFLGLIIGIGTSLFDQFTQGFGSNQPMLKHLKRGVKRIAEMFSGGRATPNAPRRNELDSNGIAGAGYKDARSQFNLNCAVKYAKGRRYIKIDDWGRAHVLVGRDRGTGRNVGRIRHEDSPNQELCYNGLKDAAAEEALSIGR
jgi:hypothetical protein